MTSDDFDVDFYRSWHADLRTMGPTAAAKHWEDFGQTEGRPGTFEQLARSQGLDASLVPADFDWRGYLSHNDDLPPAWSQWQATLHLLRSGLTEGRPWSDDHPEATQHDEDVQTLLRLDADWYRKTYGLADETVAQTHFETIGKANLLAPSEWFAPLSYWRHNPDVAAKLIDPVQHYRRSGHNESRPMSNPDVGFERSRRIYSVAAIRTARSFFGFTKDYYLSVRPDIAKLGARIDAAEHYRSSGEKEGTRPSRFFNPAFYREQYAEELSSWKGPVLDHFLAVGILLGFAPSAEVASGMRKAQLHTAIEWVGHWTGRPGFDPLERVEEEQTAPTPLVSAPTRRSEPVTRRRLNWVIPAFSRGGGGHTTIFRFARSLSRLGWESIFWVQGVTAASQIDDLYQEFIGHFPLSPVTFRRLEDGFEHVSGEFLVATIWGSAYVVAQNEHPNARLYFVQDRESLFFPAGTESLKAEHSYRLGLDFICAGPWLEDMVSSTGGKQTSFELCAEPMFSAQDPPLEERDVLAVIYLRGHTPRRASDMMTTVANGLARLGKGEVVIFGDDNPSAALDPSVVNAGVLSPQEMARLFQRSRFGLVASATNYSILPVELAAAGTVVVQPAAASVVETTEGRGAHSVEPSAEALVDFVARHADGLDQAAFDELRQQYMQFARSISWEREFENVATWLEENFLQEGAAPVATPRQKVAVVIPTYQPDEGFLDVVAAVRAQLTSFDVELQLVDTRTDGEVCPVIAQVESEGTARVHPIDKSEFQHGATRNLGASLVPDADYYAYLTQDALPASEYWLESLISPLAMLPDCAYSFGSHRAYPEHHPLYDQEMLRHFGGLGNQGYVTSRRARPARFDSEPFYVAGLSFNSDNNAGYRGDLLRRHKFPAVPFAEDQAIAKNFLVMGYSRAFAPSAVVLHSHDYTEDPDQAFKRGVEEGEALHQNFGVVRFKTAQDFFAARRHVKRQVVDDAVRMGLSSKDVKGFLDAKLRYLDGAWDASRRLGRDVS